MSKRILDSYTFCNPTLAMNCVIVMCSRRYCASRGANKRHVITDINIVIALLVPFVYVSPLYVPFSFLRVILITTALTVGAIFTFSTGVLGLRVFPEAPPLPVDSDPESGADATKSEGSSQDEAKIYQYHLLTLVQSHSALEIGYKMHW